jgi:hypothetical protein
MSSKTLYTVALALVAAALWNFAPMWFLGDSISEAWRAIWMWVVFPLSVPIFYAFIDRFMKRPGTDGDVR